jgi:2'-5' RNA ligase
LHCLPSVGFAAPRSALVWTRSSTFDIGNLEEMLQLFHLAGVGSDAQQVGRMDGDKHAGNSADVWPITATRPAHIFVGIKIADEPAEELAALARPLRPHDVRLVPSNDIHLMLVPPWDEPETAGAVGTLQAAISDIKPFVLTLTHRRFGPNLREPRLLWMECAASDELADLRIALLAAYGKSDSRPFVPHITLARIPKNSRTVARRNPIDRTFCSRSSLLPSSSFNLRCRENAGPPASRARRAGTILARWSRGRSTSRVRITGFIASVAFRRQHERGAWRLQAQPNAGACGTAGFHRARGGCLCGSAR